MSDYRCPCGGIRHKHDIERIAALEAAVERLEKENPTSEMRPEEVELRALDWLAQHGLDGPTDTFKLIRACQETIAALGAREEEKP